MQLAERVYILYSTVRAKTKSFYLQFRQLPVQCILHEKTYLKKLINIRSARNYYKNVLVTKFSYKIYITILKRWSLQMLYVIGREPTTLKRQTPN
jgi:hypothetical protein